MNQENIRPVDPSEEDYKRFEEFEGNLMSVENVKWHTDSEMESQIRKQVLDENFGEDAVESYFEKNGITVTYLSNHSAFTEIFNGLKNNS